MSDTTCDSGGLCEGERSAFTLIPPPHHKGHAPPVTHIGDDGEHIVGRGHIDPAVFVCLAVAEQATTCGLDTAAEMFQDWATLPTRDDAGQEIARIIPHQDDAFDSMRTEVDHRWAVELAGPTDPQHPDYGIVPPGDPFLRWGDVTEDTPGAVPITVLNLA